VSPQWYNRDVRKQRALSGILIVWSAGVAALICWAATDLASPLERWLIAPFLVAIMFIFIRSVLRGYWEEETKLRRITGLCPNCAYNLKGNVSGVCPECGTPVPG